MGVIVEVNQLLPKIPDHATEDAIHRSVDGTTNAQESEFPNTNLGKD